MSEDTKKEGADLYKEAKETFENAKDAVADARGELRSFKRKHKIRGNAVPEDDKTKEALAEMDQAVTDAVTAKDEAQEAMKKLKPAKGSGGGGAKYAYEQIKDKDSGEMRDMTDQEKKRWRAHARKIVPKEDNDYTDPSEVPFDATWFDPKPKKEKKEKEDKDDKKDAKADAKDEKVDAKEDEKETRKPRRKKKDSDTE